MGKYEIKNGEYVHRIKAEKVLGRKLARYEHVHHLDLDKSNNDNRNLVICPSGGYHRLLHTRTRVVQMGGDPNTESYCSYHRALHKNEEFSTTPNKSRGLHNMCRKGTNEYRKTKGLNRDKFDWKARLSQQYRRAFKRGSPISKINPWEEQSVSIALIDG